MGPGTSRAPGDKIPKPGGASTAATQCPGLMHRARHAATPQEPAGLRGARRQSHLAVLGAGGRRLLSRSGCGLLFARQSWAQAGWPGRSRAGGQSQALTRALPCGYGSRRTRGCPFLGAQLPSPHGRPGWEGQAAARAAPSLCQAKNTSPESCTSFLNLFALCLSANTNPAPPTQQGAIREAPSCCLERALMEIKQPCTLRCPIA